MTSRALGSAGRFPWEIRLQAQTRPFLSHGDVIFASLFILNEMSVFLVGYLSHSFTLRVTDSMTTHLKRDLYPSQQRQRESGQRAERKPSSQQPSLKKASYPNKHPGLVTANPAKGLDSCCLLTSHMCHSLNSQRLAQRWVASALLFLKCMTSIKYWLLILSGLLCPAYFMVLLEPI